MERAIVTLETIFVTTVIMVAVLIRKTFKLWAILLVLWLAISNAMAGENDYHITVNLTSDHHMGSGYNEDNYGLGAGGWAGGLRYEAGFYESSESEVFGNDTRYIYYASLGIEHDTGRGVSLTGDIVLLHGYEYFNGRPAYDLEFAPTVGVKVMLFEHYGYKLHHVPNAVTGVQLVYEW